MFVNFLSFFRFSCLFFQVSTQITRFWCFCAHFAFECAFKKISNEGKEMNFIFIYSFATDYRQSREMWIMCMGWDIFFLSFNIIHSYDRHHPTCKSFKVSHGEYVHRLCKALKFSCSAWVLLLMNSNIMFQTICQWGSPFIRMRQIQASIGLLR